MMSAKTMRRSLFSVSGPSMAVSPTPVLGLVGQVAPASRARWALSAVCCAALLAACGGNSSGGGGANNAPTANAGAAQTVQAGATVTLNGAGSSDPDGDTLTYSWTILARPPSSAALLNGATSVSPTFVPDAPGIYTISLVVTDNRLATGTVPATVQVTAVGGNSAPVANAGPDQSVVVGQTVTLDGVQSTDPNRDALTYVWEVTRADGTVFAPTGSTSAIASFVADRATTYTAKLIVNDGALSSGPDLISITAGTGNVPPFANTGRHTPNGEGRARYVLLNTASPTAVQLDGRFSGDANDDALGYRWSLLSRPPGSAAALAPNAATPATPSFVADVVGTYRPELITNDGPLQSAPALSTIIVGTGNVQPNASAGIYYQRVVAGDTVTLDGGSSNDANPSDVLNYSWSLVSKPAGSTATLLAPTTVRPTFVADRAGVYVASLVVNDGLLSSISDATGITALAQPGPYDGSWSGTTNQSGGTVSFRVNASQIASISFTWFPTVGAGRCVSSGTTVATTYTFTPPKPVESGSFAINEASGDVLAISTTFTGARQANGRFTLQYTLGTCVETVPVTFTATR